MPVKDAGDYLMFGQDYQSQTTQAPPAVPPQAQVVAVPPELIFQNGDTTVRMINLAYQGNQPEKAAAPAPALAVQTYAQIPQAQAQQPQDPYQRLQGLIAQAYERQLADNTPCIRNQYGTLLTPAQQRQLDYERMAYDERRRQLSMLDPQQYAVVLQRPVDMPSPYSGHLQDFASLEQVLQANRPQPQQPINPKDRYLTMSSKGVDEMGNQTETPILFDAVAGKPVALQLVQQTQEQAKLENDIRRLQAIIDKRITTKPDGSAITDEEITNQVLPELQKKKADSQVYL